LIQVLPFGWLQFLVRTIPQVTVNWAGVGMVVLCSAVILVCLQSLLNFLSRGQFRFRWTVGIFASLWLLFCLIIAVAGLTRTIPLLANERWYQPRSGYAELRMASMHASMALSEGGTDLALLRRLLMDSERGRPFWEECEVLIGAGASGKSPWIILIPRDAKARERLGFSVVAGSGSQDFLPIEKLEEKLASLRSAVPLAELR
jgi:hypothetical protein